MTKKRGISAIIATVLIILITVVAVTVVWSVVIPLINENIEADSFNVRSEIVMSEGWTAYNQESGFLYVQIRQKGDADKIEIVVSSQGNSESKIFEGTLANNQKKVYTLNLIDDLGFALSSLGSEVTVRAIPYIVNEGTEKQGTGSGDVVVKSSNQIISPPESPTSCPEGEVEYEGTCAIDLTSCGTLDQENKVYLLKNDLIGVVGDCFTITQNNIILDGENHMIEGDAVWNSGYGIYASGRMGLTIRNFANIKNFSNGIRLQSSSNSLVSSVSVRESNGSGIALSSSSNITIRDITSVFNGAKGIELSSSHNNTIESNNVRGNKNNGGIQLTASNDNIVRNNIIVANQNYGIWVWSGSQRNSLENNLVKDTASPARWGIYIRDSTTIDNKIYCGSYSGQSLNLEISGTSVIYYGPTIPSSSSGTITRQDFDCSTYCTWTGEVCE